MKIEYLTQYDLEKYIFNNIVRKRFKKKGFLCAYDFFCIVIWKVNRSKISIIKKLLKHSRIDNLEEAVYFLTSGINEIPESKEKLRHLINDWNLKLSSATAILSALFPEEFTFYDKEICGKLNNFHDIGKLTSFDDVWIEYYAYKQKVQQASQERVSLRDKDPYLWVESFSTQLIKDIECGFSNSCCFEKIARLMK